MITGLQPRGFTWVIAGRLAVSERVGGHGFQHRRVRREEEINWLVSEANVTDVVTLLAGNQNHAAYEAAGISPHAHPIDSESLRHGGAADELYSLLDDLLGRSETTVLIHREIIDDTVAGLLGGYLMSSGRVDDPILAAALIQEILGRPLGPEGRALILG